MRRDLAQLEQGPFDILVVGGGMHGAWIAWRAAAAGCRTALIERDDFGSATSANSLNILHGGLRYLQHLDFPRMRSSIEARREFARQSPHLVRPLPCVMPLQAVGVRSPWILGPALLLNDLIAGDRNRGVAETARLPRGRLLGSQECRDSIAPLAACSAAAGALWWDVLSLDSARLNLEAVLRAADAGATVANHVVADRLLLENDAVRGIAARDGLGGHAFEIRAKHVIDATGPWSGRLSAASGLPVAYLPGEWVGALNVVLRRSLGTERAVALAAASKAADGSSVLKKANRELFFVPWRGVTAIGTDYVRVDPADAMSVPARGMVEAFVTEIADAAPRSGVTLQDVAALQWGILPGETPGTGLPRKSPILVSEAAETGTEGLTVVIAEKLTSAPTLSLKVLERVLQRRVRSNVTARSLTEPGAGVGEGGRGRTLPPLGPHVYARLHARYGAGGEEILLRYAASPRLFEPLGADCEVLEVEVVHAIREEMAATLSDIVWGRLALGGVGRPRPEIVRRCAQVAAREFGWSATQADVALHDCEHWLAHTVPDFLERDAPLSV
jgi:glycerol-3-phosphate dehydrogenase